MQSVTLAISRRSTPYTVSLTGAPLLTTPGIRSNMLMSVLLSRSGRRSKQRAEYASSCGYSRKVMTAIPIIKTLETVQISPRRGAPSGPEPGAISITTQLSLMHTTRVPGGQSGALDIPFLHWVYRLCLSSNIPLRSRAPVRPLLEPPHFRRPEAAEPRNEGWPFRTRGEPAESVDLRDLMSLRLDRREISLSCRVGAVSARHRSPRQTIIRTFDDHPLPRLHRNLPLFCENCLIWLQNRNWRGTPQT